MVREKAVQYMKDRGFELFTLEEVMVLSKQGRTTLYRQITKGVLVITYVGESPRVRRSDLERYLQGIRA